MSLNADLVRSRSADIEESVARLERFKALSREAFLADQDARDVACYRLLVAIEAALSLCYHVSAKHLAKVPEDYAQCFGLLEDAGLVVPELAARLKAMARFRNLLVHVYWKLDYGRVYDVIQGSGLNDLRDFRAAIARLL